MGADLVCAICIGPERIEAERQGAAIVKALEFQEAAKKVIGMFKLAAREIGPVKPEELEAYRYVQRWWRDGAPDGFAEAALYFGIPDLEGWSPLFEDAKVIVKRVIDWWETGDASDTEVRSDPDVPGRRIVVCGDTTHGDPPSGEGYALLSLASALGIVETLGIR
jgi:hypothetical protein